MENELKQPIKKKNELQNSHDFALGEFDEYLDNLQKKSKQELQELINDSNNN